MRQSFRLCFASLVLVLLLCATTLFAQSSGQNINMVSGTDWTTGDPFLQRQNEPSIAVSTRNPAHVFGAANDYRNVDLAGLLGIEERGDAWLGIYKSFDGGQTWRSVMHPGYLFDTSAEGVASPIHGFQAAADPTVRAGTNGLFYVSGIVFNRGVNAPSAVFVTRYIDNNNRENGDPTAKSGAITNITPTDSIRFLGTTVVDRGTSGQFIDKPWLATDIPRGSATCTINFTNPDGTSGTETVPAGAVYLTYTVFTGTSTALVASNTNRINFIRSSDCGRTWSTPSKLSESNTVNQGTVVAVDPSNSSSSTGTVYVAWRRFPTTSSTGAIVIAKSTDGGLTFTKGVDAVTFPAACATTPTVTGCPFDQGLSNVNPTTGYGSSFRTNAYPSLTVDDSGRTYLAWAQRDLNGDARIMMTVSLDGLNWTAPPAAIDTGFVLDDDGSPFSNLVSKRGHQVMPTLTFNAGKLMLAYYDLRLDHTIGFFTPNADFSNFDETRQLLAELSDSSLGSVFTSFIDDATLTVRRHTIDLQGAQGTPVTPGILALPTFTTFRISRYIFGVNPFDSLNQSEQLQVNVPNLPIFVKGTQPFIGDYIDVAGAPPFVLQNGKWRFNTAPDSAHVFHAAWTDNRDVRPPIDGNWQNYTPPYSSSNSTVQHASVYDPTQTTPQCDLVAHPDRAGMRNQNVYTSRISTGVIATSPGNSKFLGFLPTQAGVLFQRAFAVDVRNTTDATRQLQFTLLDQPPDAPSPANPNGNGRASFLQQFGTTFTPPQTTLGPITIAPRASVSRPVFLQSGVAATSIRVRVTDVTPSIGGQQTFVTLNPDPTVPTLIDPANRAPTDPTIANFEVYNPAIANPAIANPAIANPAFGNPAIANPAIANPAIANPSFVAAISNPAIANPAIANPAIANPAIANPAIANPAIANPAIANQAMTDASYTIKNVGNTVGSYAVKLFGTQPSTVNLQLIVTKTYTNPVQDGCSLSQQTTTFLITNVLNPTFATLASLADPQLQDGSISNSTVSLAPSETAQVTIRAFPRDPNIQSVSVDDMRSLVLGNVTPVIVAHPANTQDALNPIAIPPKTLVITTAGTLPDAIVQQPYSQTLATLGGSGTTKTFTLASGSTLPSGLQLSSGGVLSGTPAATGTFTFTIQVADSLSTALRTFTIRIVSTLSITTTTLPDAVIGVPYPTATTLAASGGIAPLTWTVTSGALPAGLTLSTNGVISGTPSPTAATSTFTVLVTDSGSLPQTATRSLTIRVSATLSVSINALPNGFVGVPYSQTLTATGGVTPYSWSVPSGLPPGLTLNSTTGVIGGAPTTAGTFSFTVKVTDSASPQQSATQQLTLVVAAKFGLFFVVQPSDTSPGSQITPAVKVLVTDSAGRGIKGVVVTITLAKNPGGSVLSGTNTATTGNNGIAVFANQSLNKGGTGYQMQATAPALPGAAPAFSNLFNIR